MAINIDLVISAKNLAGAAFTSFNTGLKGAQANVSNFAKSFSSINKEVTEFRRSQAELGQEGVTSSGVLNSGLLTILGTVGLLTTAYNKLQQVASSAINAQFERVTDINTITQTLGTNLQESTKLTDEARKQISQFGVNLPISTGDVRTAYSLVIDDYAAALKGKLTNEQIVSATTSDAARLGIIRGSLNDTGRVAFASNISSLLAGSTGVGSINQLAIAQNVQFKNAYLDELKKRNVQNLGQLDPGSKIQAFNAILEKVVTPEQIALLQGTARAQLSSITDKLFDPEVGIFSFARNLSKDGTTRKTVIDEATKTLDLLFGDKGLITMLGAKKFFGSGDPMMPFFNAVQAINTYIENVNQGIAKLKSVSPALAGELIGKTIADVTNAVINGILGAVASINWGGVIVGAASGIAAFFGNLDWKVYALAAVALVAAVAIPQIVGAVVLFCSIFFGLLSVVVSGGTVLLVVAAGLALAALTRFIVQNIDGIKSTAIQVSNAIDGTFNSVVDATGSFLQRGWAAFIRGYYDISNKADSFINSSLSAVVGGTQSFFEGVANWVSDTVDWLSNATGNFFDQTGAVISNLWSKAVTATTNGFNSVVQGVLSFFTGIGEWISNIFGSVGDAVNGIIDQIKAIIDSVLHPIQSAVGGLVSSVSSALNPSSVATNVSNTVSSATSAVGNALSSAANSVLSFFGARYKGNIPWKSAAGGLYDAIAQEVQNKPSNAGLVVANTSELILPQSQITPFLNANSRGATTINVGGINLNLTGNTSIEIAEQAIQLIESRLASELDSVLA